jgi:HAMP domain-containing protein
MSYEKKDIEQSKNYLLNLSTSEENIVFKSPDNPLLGAIISAIANEEKSNLIKDTIYNSIKALLLPEQALLKSKLIDELDFQRSLSQAFKVEQRIALKKKLLQFEKDLTIDSDAAFEKDLPLAFKLEERRALKERLQEIERESYGEKVKASLSRNYDFTSAAEADVPYAMNRRPNYFKYGAAAVTIGITILVSYFISNNISERRIALNKAKHKIEKKDSIIEIPLEIVAFKFPEPTFVQKTFDVNTETTFGFSETNKNFTINQINIDVEIDRLMSFLQKYMVENQGKAGDDPTNLKLDSLGNENERRVIKLRSQKNTYIYNKQEEELTIYTDQKIDKVIQLNLFKDNVLFLKMDSSYYKILPTTKSLNLKPENDQMILERLDKINFNSN